MSKCDGALTQMYPQYKRNSGIYRSYTFFGWLQPWVAWVGLIGCILVFVFSSAPWWSKPATFTKVAVAYAAVCVSCSSSMVSPADSKLQHIILFALWVILKIIRKKPWVHLDPDASILVRELHHLTWLKQDEQGEQGEELGVQNHVATDQQQGHASTSM